MDTSIIVLIAVVVLVLVALLVALPRLRAAREEKQLQGRRQLAADRHHAEADDKLARAQEIEHRAEAQRAEVELAERQAEARRAEVEMAERKAAAVRAEAEVSRSTASRTEQGMADDEIDLSGEDDRRARTVHEADPRNGDSGDDSVRDFDRRDDRAAAVDSASHRDRPV